MDEIKEKTLLLKLNSEKIERLETKIKELESLLNVEWDDERVKEIENKYKCHWFGLMDADEVEADIQTLLSQLKKCQVEKLGLEYDLELGTIRLQDWANKCRIAEARVKELELALKQYKLNYAESLEVKHTVIEKLNIVETKVKELETQVNYERNRNEGNVLNVDMQFVLLRDQNKKFKEGIEYTINILEGKMVFSAGSLCNRLKKLIEDRNK